MRTLLVALLLMLTRPCVWSGSNNTYGSRSVPQWRSGAKSLSAGAPARNVRSARNASHGHDAASGIKRHPPPRRAFLASHPRPHTGTSTRICRGCR
jgi:hypothetical protein